MRTQTELKKKIDQTRCSEVKINNYQGDSDWKLNVTFYDDGALKIWLKEDTYLDESKNQKLVITEQNLLDLLNEYQKFKNAKKD
jgi:hypothetical protein